ncbi:hypothetical protein NKOR_07490 [Candidatus Nitrosopumilus koreensis AR1]|uniref:Uncharacterized protein n=2 Tax=Nitrosopumilaceae TaxID=338190 RepID=K0B7A0_9ARCH|nr:hypothetical protein NKOR_07490 [Candidatus Nitrosopumilus koreensis AR1]
MKRFFQKTAFLTSILIISTILMYSQVSSNMAFADDEGIPHEYDFVAGIHNVATFHFRDGVETVNFPVFSTTSDIVSGSGTSFSMEGVVGHNPHLHMALDEAYKFRLAKLTGGSAFEYDHRFFDADVKIMQADTTLKSFSYRNCEITSHSVTTQNDDYESYHAANSGFAIVNSIEFNCGGVSINQKENFPSVRPGERTFTDYGALPFKQANDLRTFLTFDFDNGAEKIESVIFTSTGGFSEEDIGTPSFQIITAVLPHPLIDNAIIKSQKVDGLATSFNEDFDVNVEFVIPEKLSGLTAVPEQKIRGLEYEGCIVSGYDILTLQDKEEGYTGKRGFATAEILDVECSGLSPVNPDNEPEPVTVDYNMGTGPKAVATFSFDSGTEIVEFPEFYQGNLIARANPTFELVGVPGVTPLLYDVVDNARKAGAKSTGVSSNDELFNVKIDLMYGDVLARGYDYSSCHVTDYILKTEHDLEESFYNGFALTNEFHFECSGYSPIDPHLGMNDPKKGDVESSKDYQKRQRSTWGPGFEYVPK